MSVCTTGTGACDEPPPPCAAGCGSDWFPEEADCLNGAWVCPPGTVNPSDCPPGTCWGPPLTCEVCGPSGWECVLEPSCVGSCNDLVCAVCPESPGPVQVGICVCECDANGSTTCGVLAGCCEQDMDCGDLVYTPCVNNVCNETVDGKCWTDVECPMGTVCTGASVCPCGYDCDGFDTPGDCLPPP